MGDGWSIRDRWKSLPIDGGEPSEVLPETVPTSGEEAPPPLPKTGTFIGSGALFQGTLRLKGDFCIDSEFHGSLDTDGTLTVGPSGSVEGDIRAREVIVVGAVVGNIVARRQLIVRAGARLHGDIETACLEIERHAYFNGRTAMTRPYADARPASAQTSPVPSPETGTAAATTPPPA